MLNRYGVPVTIVFGPTRNCFRRVPIFVPDLKSRTIAPLSLLVSSVLACGRFGIRLPSVVLKKPLHHAVVSAGNR